MIWTAEGRMRWSTFSRRGGSTGVVPQPPYNARMIAPAAPASALPGSLEGTVKKVDASTGTVRVSSGLFGLFPRTLEVTGETQVQVEGRQGTLMDVHEGAKVKAAYELRQGKNVATRLE